MSVINQNLLLTPEGYQISRSVRLRSSAGGFFNRTPSSAGNRKTFTWSGWVKRGAINSSGYYSLFSAGTTSPTYDGFRFGLDSLQFFQAGGNTSNLVTTSVYRDASAWYHVVLAVDTTQATSSNRVKIYVNGVQTTSFSTANYPSLNTEASINNTLVHNVGAQQETSASFHFDGYLTEVNLIDGQALTPSSFGETDAVTGVWKPKKYAGTYGTNGFYLNFSDPSAATAAAIGKDNSGNGNNWTPNNISVTAGVTYDSMVDVPTMYADGGNGRGNYCVLNPVFKNANTTYGVMATPIEGNLNTVSMGAGTNVYGSIDLFGNKGKWYAECRASSITSQVSIGFLSDDGNLNRGAWINSSSGVLVDNVSKGTGGFASGNTIGIAYDSINNTVQFYVNNSAVGSAYTTSTGAFSSYFFWAYTNSGVSLEWNFGQRPFAYTPPTGFKALNTQNLPDATIKKGNQYFDVSTWTGDQAARTITNSGAFQPDLIWTKSRSDAESHRLHDAVRGGNGSVLYELNSNLTEAEGTDTLVSGFASNGFTIASGANTPNITGRTYVGWQWKESASAGFDIVTYSGTGAAQTVAHSLGVTPRMIIAKRRNGAQNWFVGHGSFASWSSAIEGLNTTAAVNNGATAVWNATAPTSSVFSVGTDLSASGGTYVAYLFAEVAGFSKFGSYTGNGSADGPFVYCGFRPRWVMIKPTVGTGSWQILDTARDTYNVEGNLLWANESTAETSSPPRIDVLSNGFKARAGAGSAPNVSGEVYIYAAFAENPFKNSLAR